MAKDILKLTRSFFRSLLYPPPFFYMLEMGTAAASGKFTLTKCVPSQKAKPKRGRGGCFGFVTLARDRPV